MKKRKVTVITDTTNSGGDVSHSNESKRPKRRKTDQTVSTSSSNRVVKNTVESNVKQPTTVTTNNTRNCSNSKKKQINSDGYYHLQSTSPESATLSIYSWLPLIRLWVGGIPPFEQYAKLKELVQKYPSSYRDICLYLSVTECFDLGCTFLIRDSLQIGIFKGYTHMCVVEIISPVFYNVVLFRDPRASMVYQKVSKSVTSGGTKKITEETVSDSFFGYVVYTIPIKTFDSLVHSAKIVLLEKRAVLKKPARTESDLSGGRERDTKFYYVSLVSSTVSESMYYVEYMYNEFAPIENDGMIDITKVRERNSYAHHVDGILEDDYKVQYMTKLYENRRRKLVNDKTKAKTTNYSRQWVHISPDHIPVTRCQRRRSNDVDNGDPRNWTSRSIDLVSGSDIFEERATESSGKKGSNQQKQKTTTTKLSVGSYVYMSWFSETNSFEIDTTLKDIENSDSVEIPMEDVLYDYEELDELSSDYINGSSICLGVYIPLFHPSGEYILTKESVEGGEQDSSGEKRWSAKEKRNVFFPTQKYFGAREHSPIQYYPVSGLNGTRGSVNVVVSRGVPLFDCEKDAINYFNKVADPMVFKSVSTTSVILEESNRTLYDIYMAMESIDTTLFHSEVLNACLNYSGVRHYNDRDMTPVVRKSVDKRVSQQQSISDRKLSSSSNERWSPSKPYGSYGVSKRVVYMYPYMRHKTYMSHNDGAVHSSKVHENEYASEIEDLFIPPNTMSHSYMVEKESINPFPLEDLTRPSPVFSFCSTCNIGVDRMGSNNVLVSDGDYVVIPLYPYAIIKVLGMLQTSQYGDIFNPPFLSATGSMFNGNPLCPNPNYIQPYHFMSTTLTGGGGNIPKTRGSVNTANNFPFGTTVVAFESMGGRRYQAKIESLSHLPIECFRTLEAAVSFVALHKSEISERLSSISLGDYITYTLPEYPQIKKTSTIVALKLRNRQSLQTIFSVRDPTLEPCPSVTNIIDEDEELPSDGRSDLSSSHYNEQQQHGLNGDVMRYMGMMQSVSYVTSRPHSSFNNESPTQTDVECYPSISYYVADEDRSINPFRIVEVHFCKDINMEKRRQHNLQFHTQKEINNSYNVSVKREGFISLLKHMGDANPSRKLFASLGEDDIRSLFIESESKYICYVAENDQFPILDQKCLAEKSKRYATSSKIGYDKTEEDAIDLSSSSMTSVSTRRNDHQRPPVSSKRHGSAPTGKRASKQKSIYIGGVPYDFKTSTMLQQEFEEDAFSDSSFPTPLGFSVSKPEPLFYRVYGHVIVFQGIALQNKGFYHGSIAVPTAVFPPK